MTDQTPEIIEIEWVDSPPPRDRGPGAESKYAPAIRALRSHPKRWGIITRSSGKSPVEHLKAVATRITGTERYQWEFTCRRRTAYGRYIGDEAT